MSGWILPEDMGREIFRFLFMGNFGDDTTLMSIKDSKAFRATCRDFKYIADGELHKIIPLILSGLNPIEMPRPIGDLYSFSDLTAACAPYESGIRYWTRKSPDKSLRLAIEESKVYTWEPKVIHLCENATAPELENALEDCIGVFSDSREGRVTLRDRCIDKMSNCFFSTIVRETDPDKIRKDKNYLVASLLLSHDEEDMITLRRKLKRKGLNFKHMQVMRFIFDVMKEYSIDQVISVFAEHIIGRETSQTKGKPLAERTITVAMNSGYIPLIERFMELHRRLHRKREPLLAYAMENGSKEVIMAVLQSSYKIRKSDSKGKKSWVKRLMEYADGTMTALLIEKGLISRHLLVSQCKRISGLLAVRESAMPIITTI